MGAEAIIGDIHFEGRVVNNFPGFDGHPGDEGRRPRSELYIG